jgi:signal peptidase I
LLAFPDPAGRPEGMTDTASASPAPAPASAGLRREVFDIVRTTGLGLAIALALRVVVFQPFTIPSSSMEPGLVTGDYIVVSKLDYGLSRASFPLNPPLFKGRFLERAARRGDVVVFRLPRDPAQTWIKRVIGLPGDRVQVRGGQVFVNGGAVPQAPLGVTRDHDAPERPVLAVGERAPDGRAYVTYDGGPGQPGDDTDVYVVPAGQYFVMGDNRDNSLDSRFPRELGVGLLPAENLVGKARFVILSWRSGASILKPWTWLDLQTDRFFKPIR